MYTLPDRFEFLSDAWLDEARSTYRAARDEAMRLCAAPCFAPDGATYLFVDLSRWAPAGCASCGSFSPKLACFPFSEAPPEFGAALCCSMGSARGTQLPNGPKCTWLSTLMRMSMQ